MDTSAGRCSRTTTDAYCHFGFGLTTWQSFGTGGVFFVVSGHFSSWWQLKYFFVNVHLYILGVSWSHFDEGRRIFFNWVELKQTTSFCKDIVLGQVVLGGGNTNIFNVHPYLGKIPMLTNIFQIGLKPPTRVVFWRYPLSKSLRVGNHVWIMFFLYIFSWNGEWFGPGGLGFSGYPSVL